MPRDIPAPDRPLRAAMDAIVGSRERQEDLAEIVPFVDGEGDPGELLILADGMGGHARGDVASRTAVDAFRAAFLDDTAPLGPRLRGALDAANAALAEAVQRNAALAGMGCTLIGAVVKDDLITWVSVGDSLLLQCAEAGARTINRLHSVGAQIDREVEQGLRSRESAVADPQRHMLLSALTGGAIAMIDEGAARLDAGALVLLASDGIETLPRDRIARIAGQADSPAAAIQALLTAISATMAPDQDNTTMIATRVATTSCPPSRLPRPVLRHRLLVALAIALLIGSTATLTSLVWLIFDRTPPAPARAKAAAAAPTTEAGAPQDTGTPPQPPPGNPFAPRPGPFDGWLHHGPKPATDKAKPAAPPAPVHQDPHADKGAESGKGAGPSKGLAAGQHETQATPAIPTTIPTAERENR